MSKKEHYEFLKKYLIPSLMNPKNGYIVKDIMLGSDYYFPKRLESNNPEKDFIDIENLRQRMPRNNLEIGNSCYFRSFTSDILDKIKPEKSFTREYVIPVDIKQYRLYLQRTLGLNSERIKQYKSLKSSSGKSNRLVKEWYKTYFLLDAYFPDYSIDIEIDGSRYHYQDIDRARDDYIKEIYGIETFRFINYGNRKTDYTRLSKIFKNLIPRPKRNDIDISDWVLKYFMHESIVRRQSFFVFWRIIDDLIKKFGDKFINYLKEGGGKLKQRATTLRYISKNLGIYYSNIENDLKYIFSMIGIKLVVI